MSKSLVRIWIAALLLLGLYVAPQAAAPISAADGAPELFLPATESQSAAAAPRENALRWRTVLLNHATLAQLGADGEGVRLSLFPDAVFTAIFTAREDSITGGHTLSGTLQGMPGSAVTLAVQDDAVFASINTGAALYRARSTTGGMVLIEQMDSALPGAELEPLEPQGESIPAETLGTPGGDDDGSRIDVLVVYTSALSSYLGSTALNALINTAVAETNQGYANSQVNQRVTLAGTMQVTWNEAGFDWGTTLSNLKNGVAPFQNVAATRDAVRADLVTLLVLDYYYTSCGIGYLMTYPSIEFDDYAYTVVAEDCATGYYSFAHEQGHNEGAHHDRATAGGDAVIYPYAYGYWMWSPTLNRYLYRTIMAYECPSGCTRINYWSNPNVSYNGLPTGVAAGLTNAADNHLTLNNTAPYVAKFRDGLPPNAPTGFSATDLSATSFRLNWTDASSDETGFKLYRAPIGTTSWVQIATLPAGSNTYTDSGLTAGADFAYKLVAYSGNGASSAVMVNAVHVPPSAPTSLSATPASMIRINLGWVDTSLNETGFKIYRSLSSTTGFSQIGTAAANAVSYSDASLPCSTTPVPYYYRVRAYNEEGDSPESNTSSATPLVCTAPPVPSPASCYSNMDSMTLLWTNVDGETLYEAQYKKTADTTWSVATSVAKDITTLRVTGLLKGTSYDMRVRAHNDLGDSAYVTCTSITKTRQSFLPMIKR